MTSLITTIVGQRFRYPSVSFVAAACDSIKAGAPATLVREPENPHDSNAIAVYIPSPVEVQAHYKEGQSGLEQCGYIPRHDAAVLAPLMDEGKIGEAKFIADKCWSIEIECELEEPGQ